MPRIYSNLQGGILDTQVDTTAGGSFTLSSPGFANLPAVASPNTMMIVLDPDGYFGAPEILSITALTAGATTCTATGAQDGTSGRVHYADETWVHGWLASDASGIPMDWKQTVVAYISTPTATVGTWAGAVWTDVSFLASGSASGRTNSSAAQNDAIAYKLSMSAGTWTISAFVRESTNTGIITFQVDGTTVGTGDTYAASVVPNSVSVTGVSIATSGVHEIRLVMATKNASSTGYILDLLSLDLTRTA